MRSPFALTLDVLEVANRVARANGEPPPFEVRVLRPGQRLPPRTAALVVPGTGAATWREVEQQLASSEARWLRQLLRRAAASGVRIAASCSAVCLLAAADLLGGHAATTAWFLAPAMTRRFPDIRVLEERVVVESGLCMTAGAALAHADLMLMLVERLAGPRTAEMAARYLLLDRRQSQRPYLVLGALLSGEPRLAAAESWIKEHLAAPFSIGELAAAVSMSERSFARLVQQHCGCSPIRMVQQIRLHAAGEYLRRGLSQDEVAPLVGYADASALRRVRRQRSTPASRALRSSADSRRGGRPTTKERRP